MRGGRYFAAGTARRWGMADRADDVAVVASELLTNALRHATPADVGARPGNGVRLGLLQPDGPSLLCVVADEDPRPPVSRDPEDFAENGRGLHIVAALSDDWGYAILGDAGKVVWALFSAVTSGCC
ncbi:MAG TPA: ATP-binding protein [Streptosporangiaceae bacterium]|nr:ATP-binding protein [Streptosporangiaceae bacterium]